MSKPGGNVITGIHVGSGNVYADKIQYEKYWNQYENRYKVQEGYRFRAKHSFVCALTGKRLPSTSKYMPHQGEREIARRLRKQRNL